MSLFTAQGKDVLQKEEKNDINVKEVKKYLSSGDSIKVRITSADQFREYYSHGGYNLAQNYKIYNSVCTRHTGTPDAYDKAVNLMYEDLEGMTEGSPEHTKLKGIVSELRAKRKMLFGFIDLSTGNEIILEVTGNQGDALAAQILEYEDSIQDMAFKVSKTGSGAQTAVNLMPIVNPAKGLNAQEKANFEATAGQVFNEELYEKVLFVKKEEDMVRDLVKLGFDVTRIGYEPPADQDKPEQPKQPEEQKQPENKPEEPAGQPDISEDDLPF
jgi:hypothetical protein